MKRTTLLIAVGALLAFVAGARTLAPARTYDVGVTTFDSEGRLFGPDAVAAGEVVTVSVFDAAGHPAPTATVGLELDAVQVEGLVVNTDSVGRKTFQVPPWLLAAGTLAIVASIDGGPPSRKTCSIRPDGAASSGPKLQDRVPTLSSATGVLSLNGSGLSGNPGRLKLTMGGQPVPPQNVLSASTHEIKVIPPPNTPTGETSIVAEVDGKSSNACKARIVKLEMISDRATIKTGETANITVVAQGARPGETVAVDVWPATDNISLSPNGRVRLAGGKGTLRAKGTAPGRFAVAGTIASEPKEFSEDYPQPREPSDLAEAVRDTGCDKTLRDKLTNQVQQAQAALASGKGQEAATNLTQFRKDASNAKGLTRTQAAFLTAATVAVLQNLYVRGRSQPDKGSGKVTEGTIVFAPDTFKEITIAAPGKLGGRRTKANLVGECRFTVDTSTGMMKLTSMNAHLDPATLKLDLNGDGTLELLDTGLVTLRLTDQPFAADLVERCGQPNVGHWDRATNSVRVTFGVEAECALLTRLEQPPLRIIISEYGRCDKTLAHFNLTGWGTSRTGLFTGFLFANYLCGDFGPRKPNPCEVSCGGCSVIQSIWPMPRWPDEGQCNKSGTTNCEDGEACKGGCKEHTVGPTCPGCGGTNCHCKFGKCSCGK